MNDLMQEAMRVAIVTEKNSFDFYRSAAAQVQNSNVRRLCERLADEEARHLELFLAHYPGSEFGDLQRLLADPPHLTSPMHRALLSGMTGSTGEKEALKLALQEEELCLDHYSVLVAALREPVLHAVFQIALDETHRHCELLREEYRHLMGIDSLSDQDVYLRE
jgi:rubrerythrin